MTNDFGQDFAQELAEYFSAGTDVTAPPGTVYVTLYDDTGSELNGDLQNGRVGVSPGSGWDQGADATEFENANEINFGDNTSGSTITVQEFAIKDSDNTDTNALEYFRADVQNAPQDFSDGTRVFFAAGELSVNVLDQGTD